VKLPGGFVATPDSANPQGGLVAARLQNEFRFKTRSGALQLLLQERRQYCLDNHLSHAHWVSELLSAILVQLGDFTCTGKPDDQLQLLARVGQLCVADRQFILWQWRLLHEKPVEWMSNQCPECAAYYDFPLDWQMLPLKPASADYPFAKLTLGSHSIYARVPNGSDQEKIADWLKDHPTATPIELQRALLRNLLIVDEAVTKKAGDEIDKNIDKKTYAAELAQAFSGELSEEFINEVIDELSDEQLVAIEQALEQVAPELASAIQLACPECGCEHQVHLDLYQQLLAPINQLLDEIHQLALHYHWREEDILQLPDVRRHAYLQRLDISQGRREAV
jgi:hypothetical protein